jgi:hypothetical protein
MVWTALGLAAALAGCTAATGQGQARATAVPGVGETFRAMKDALKNEGGHVSSGEVDRYLKGVDDTARIVYVGTVRGQTQLFSIQPDGQKEVQLTDTETYKCRPAWSLDHTQIAFFQYAQDRPVGDVVSVIVIDADGSNPREIIASKRIDTKKTRIGWKPDGSVIYVQEKDFPSVLFGYALATGQQVDTVRLPKDSFIKEAQTLSPDLEMIAGMGPDKKTGLMHMGAVKRAGGNFSDLDFMTYFQAMPFHLGTVAWSYDSRLVAFELDVTTAVMSSSYDPLNFKFYPITPMEADAAFTCPAFSPRGKFITCVFEKTKEGQIGSGDKEVRSDIWIALADGTKAHPITSSGACFDPSW